MAVREIVPADRAAHAKRKRLEHEYLFVDATNELGYDTIVAIIEAVNQKSEEPLTRLPDRWREKAIAAFREQQAKKGEVVRLIV
jgi:hypothetical protein